MTAIKEISEVLYIGGRFILGAFNMGEFDHGGQLAIFTELNITA